MIYEAEQDGIRVEIEDSDRENKFGLRILEGDTIYMMSLHKACIVAGMMQVALDMYKIKKKRKSKNKVQKQIDRYLKDPKTRVFINTNNENGTWLHAVQVKGTDFWLASFQTEKEALEYIKKNDLHPDWRE